MRKATEMERLTEIVEAHERVLKTLRKAVALLSARLTAHVAVVSHPRVITKFCHCNEQPSTNIRHE